MPQKPIILIAEDDVNLSEILKSKLASLGYDVLLAHDGASAEKLIMEKRPDLSLLDIMMPQKSGLEVLESMSKNPDTKNIPAFMLSNLGQKKDMDAATSFGAKDYLVKANSSLADIVSKVDQYLKANPPKERPPEPLVSPESNGAVGVEPKEERAEKPEGKMPEAIPVPQRIPLSPQAALPFPMQQQPFSMPPQAFPMPTVFPTFPIPQNAPQMGYFIPVQSAMPPMPVLGYFIPVNAPMPQQQNMPPSSPSMN